MKEFDEDLEAIKEASNKLMNGEEIEEVSTEKKRLDESYTRVKKAVSKKKKLERDLIEFEIMNKSNEVLQKYMKLLKDIEDANKSIEEEKPELEEAMRLNNEKKYETDDFKISRKDGSIRRSLNSEAFFQDFAPNSRMYKKYVKETEVKGSVTIKIVD